ncbi:DinB family protein [Pedobacter glucosidilyticus]|uniref:DinB family protein n=1 Tax=Pedobacter glucosidilyticus TaxID=1122941 RepID=UPI0003F669C9|nr:DinB family protein [Pedobacter glucosidilyticus]
MSVKSDFKSLNKLLDKYLRHLKAIHEDKFFAKPEPHVWSVSEVYSHVIWVNKTAAIAAENCLNRTAHIKTSKPDWRVRLILFFGVFPPGKIKAPAAVASKVERISAEEAANQIINLKRKLPALEADFKNFDPHYKIKHPRLGYLDAKDWLRFMVVHTKHHIKQL